MNDTDTMKKLAIGDEDVFHHLFDRYYSKVYYFILNLVKSIDDSEDLAQDVFIKIWTNRAAFKEVKNFEAYLYVLTRNSVFTYFQSKYTRYSFESTDSLLIEQIADESPYEDLIAKDLQLLIDMKVDAMPPQRKKVYQLSRQFGMSSEEIALKLGITKKTVENHLNLALKELHGIISIYLLMLKLWE